MPLTPQFTDRIFVGKFDDPGHLPLYFFGQRLGIKIFSQPLILSHCPFVKAFMAPRHGKFALIPKGTSAFNDKSVSGVRKIQVAVEFGCGANFAGFYSAVIRRVAKDKIGGLAVVKI